MASSAPEGAEPPPPSESVQLPKDSQDSQSRRSSTTLAGGQVLTLQSRNVSSAPTPDQGEAEAAQAQHPQTPLPSTEQSTADQTVQGAPQTQGTWDDKTGPDFRDTPQVEGWRSYNTNRRQGNDWYNYPSNDEVMEFQGRRFSHTGIVKYQKPDGTSQYIGNFGLKPADAYSNGQVLARFVTNNPKTDGVPYLGIPLSLPRSLDDFEHPERYGRGIKQPDKAIRYSEFLLIEPRLYCDTFDMRSRIITGEEKEKVFKDAGIAVPENDVFELHLSLLDGQHADVYGLNWPYIPRPGEATTVLKSQSLDFSNAREWTLYLPQHGTQPKVLAFMGMIFGQKARGQTWQQYSHHGRFGITWNPLVLDKFSPYHQQENGQQFIKFGFQGDFANWTSYYVKHGFGTAQEVLTLLAWCNKVANTPIKSQWMHFEEGRNNFTVSVDCPFESFSSNRLLQPGEELDLYFSPPPEKPVKASTEKEALDDIDGENDPAEDKSDGENDPAEDKSDGGEEPAAEKPDGGDLPTAEPQTTNLRPAWHAVVLDNDNIFHPGSLLLQVQRPRATRGRDRPVLDDRVIPSGPQYDLDLADVDIYLDIKESTTTVKTRLNALNIISNKWLDAQPSRSRRRPRPRDNSENLEDLHYQLEDDGGDEEDLAPAPLHPENPFTNVDFRNQMSILMCHSLPREQTYDFTEGISEEQRQSIFQGCTQKEKLVVDKCLHRVPGNGLLMIRGAAGVGKTTFSTRVLHLQLLRSKRLLTMAATNQAVNNIASRMFAQLAGVEDDFLVFRFWTERLEVDIVKSTDPTNIAAVAARITKGYSANIGYDVDRSLANAILELAGLKATTNKKILALRPQHQNLGTILSKNLRDRSEDDRKNLNSLLRDAMNALIAAADMIFTTTTLSGTKPIRKFVSILDIVCVDEAACATELEILIGWKGDKPVILAADIEQLLPPIFSDGIKDEHGVLVNSFVPQLEVPLIRRLRDADWPYVDLREQRRMPPGQFDAANYCIYTNVEMAEGVTIELEQFEMARRAEAWSITLCASGIYATGKNEPRLPRSEKGKITPALVAIKNSYCYTIPGGTSKANTAIAHFVLSYITLIKIYTGATNKMIVIVVPYLQQRRLYLRTILAAFADFGGITVATANSFMGWEKPYVFVDLTAAENLGGKVGFVADKHRLAVVLTRQQQFLMVFADPRCTVVKKEGPEAHLAALSLRRQGPGEVVENGWGSAGDSNSWNPAPLPSQPSSDGGNAWNPAPLPSQPSSGGGNPWNPAPPQSQPSWDTGGQQDGASNWALNANQNNYGSLGIDGKQDDPGNLNPVVNQSNDGSLETGGEQHGANTWDLAANQGGEVDFKQFGFSKNWETPSNPPTQETTSPIQQAASPTESGIPPILSDQSLMEASAKVMLQPMLKIKNYRPLEKIYIELQSRDDVVANTFQDFAAEMHGVVSSGVQSVLQVLQDCVYDYSTRSPPANVPQGLSASKSSFPKPAGNKPSAGSKKRADFYKGRNEFAPGSASNDHNPESSMW